MAGDGEVHLDVRPELDTRELKRTQDRLERDFDDSNKRIGLSFGTMAKAAGAAFAAAGLGTLAKNAITGASDLAETQSKVEAIFGDSADEVKAFAGTAARSLGQTKQQALDASATFALFGRSAGLTGDKLAGFSTEFTTLATDLASFNNTSPQEAIDALGASLRGESEPMRKFGVVIDDAALRAQAMSMKIYDGSGALTQQQKVLAAHALILAKTTIQQGDFARTSGGLAGQQKILGASLQDLSTNVGTFLLPVMTELMGAFRGVAEWVGKLVDVFKKDGLGGAVAFVKDEFGKLLDKLGPVGDVLRDVGTAIGKVVDFVKGNLPEVIAFIGTGLVIALGHATVALYAKATAWWAANSAAIIANAQFILLAVAIAALVAGIVWAYKNVGWFRDVVDTLASFLQDTVWPAIKKVADVFMDVFVPAVQAIWDKIQAFGGWLKDVFSGDWTAVWDGVKDTFAAVWEGFVKLITEWIPQKFLPALGEVGKAALKWIGDEGPGILAKLGEWTLKFVAWVVEMNLKLLAALGEWIVKDLLPWIVDQGPKLLAKLGEWTLKFVAWVVEMNLKLLAALGEWIVKDLLPWIGAQAEKLLAKLADWTAQFVAWVAGLAGSMVSGMAGVISWIGDQAANLPGVLGRWTGEFVEWVGRLGSAAAGAVANFASTVGQAIVDWVKDRIGDLFGGAGGVGGGGQGVSKSGKKIEQKNGQWIYSDFGTPVPSSDLPSGASAPAGSNGSGGAVKPLPTTLEELIAMGFTPDQAAGIIENQRASGAVRGITGSLPFGLAPGGDGGGTGGGGGYSPTEIAKMAKAVGFSGNAARIMGAVGYAESSGNPSAIGDVALQNATWGPSVGLTQVRSLWAEDNTGKTRDRFSLKDPTFNLKSALAISGGGTNFKPWTMYTNGTYAKYLNDIPALARGGTAHRSGWSVIGERGPEMAWMPRGASVVPLDRAGQFTPPSMTRADLDRLGFSNGGGAGRTVNINNFGLRGVTLDEREVMKLMDRAERLAAVPTW